MNDSLLFDCNGETAARAATEALTRHDFRVVRSFDLRSALAPLAAHADCECPHHGTAQCTCQFVVLLAYGDPSTGSGGAPVVVTAHSRDIQAQVQIVHDANTQPDRKTDRVHKGDHVGCGGHVNLLRPTGRMGHQSVDRARLRSFQ